MTGRVLSTMSWISVSQKGKPFSFCKVVMKAIVRKGFCSHQPLIQFRVAFRQWLSPPPSSSPSRSELGLISYHAISARKAVSQENRDVPKKMPGNSITQAICPKRTNNWCYQQRGEPSRKNIYMKKWDPCHNFEQSPIGGFFGLICVPSILPFVFRRIASVQQEKPVYFYYNLVSYYQIKVMHWGS